MRHTFPLASVATLPFFAAPLFARNTFDPSETLISGGLPPIAVDAPGRSSGVVTAQTLQDPCITTVSQALPSVCVNRAGSAFTRARIRGIKAASWDSKHALNGQETAKIEGSGALQATNTLALGRANTHIDARNPNNSVAIRRRPHALALRATLDTFGGHGTLFAALRYVAGNSDTQFRGGSGAVELLASAAVDVAERTDTGRHSARITNLPDVAADV